MAQLPPKAPNMTPNWHSQIPIQMMHMNRDFISNAAAQQPPTWVDEFLDFSSARRNAHRRSTSESIAFLPLLEDCPTPSPPLTENSSSTFGFERLDDEQLMAMFADERASNPSTPSDQAEKPPPTPHDHDHDQVHQQLKEEPLDASCEPDRPLPAAKPSNTDAASSGDTIVDPKRVKRILANRQSAQRSRVRKLQYISELERSVTSLQTEVSTLSPRVAFLDHQRLILNVDNSTLKQRIAALVQDKIFKDAHQEALKNEIERLRQVYREQNLKKMSTAAPPPPCSDHIGSTGKDELILARD